MGAHLLDAAPNITGSWGSYTLGRRIGRGGMGVVHAAVRRGFGGIAQLVAVKVMIDGGAERAAFLREARILARLDHPNVVRWLDAGEVGADVYLAMELLHGASLAAIVAASPDPLPLPTALAILTDLARGLHAAHELCDDAGSPLGLVHQDVSPQNAVVGYDGRTRLVDFGVARLVSVDASRTDTVRGKPAYLAPEQLDGRRVDRRTDVFALGVIAFELLTGRRLFARASIAETHTAVLFEPIPDPRDARSDLPAGLAAAITRALARSTNDRFPTAEAFRRAVADAAEAAGVPYADEREVAALAAARVPAAWMPHELFAEIEGRSRSGELDTVSVDEASQAVTIAPRRARAAAGDDRALPEPDARPAHPDAARASITPPASRAPRWIGLAAAACVALGIVFGLRALGRPAAHVANGPPVASAPPPPHDVPTSAPTNAPADSPEPVAPSRGAVPGNGAHVPEVRRQPKLGAVATARAIATPPAASTATLVTTGETPAEPAPPAPAPPPTAAPVSAPANGWISVWSSRWGRVHIDGRDVGDSPAVRIVVPPGPHVVGVRTATGEQTRSVVVVGGEDAKVRFVF